LITSKGELREYIAADNTWYIPWNFKERMLARIAHYPKWRLKKYLIYLRKQEYYINTANGSKIKGFLGLYYEGKKNRLGEKLGIEIGPNCFGKGLQIYHGSIIVNSLVRAGEFCVLHGGNCIGNNGFAKASPQLGNHVDVGYGATLIGDIQIADDCIIGANALVNRSFEETGRIIVGVPAKSIKKRES
jgi:serine O-acetyltransferase